MTYKEQLYYLLKEYSENRYTTDDFCDQFTIIYNTKLDYSDLNKTEEKLFHELDKITARFSPYEDDLKLKNVYFSEDDVKNKVAEVCEILL